MPGPNPDEPADEKLTQLSNSLYVMEDTCNAYAIVDDGDALVIDPGSGAVLDALLDRGVENVEWVLHTHHHRDQCWGDHRLLEHGADIAVPEYERHLFEDVETFWANKRIYDNYNDRSTFFTLPRSVPVATTLDDYDTFEWREYSIDVLPAKGHTFGSSTLLTEVDGARVAFVGDLMRAGGRLHQLHAMEYGYGDMKGIPFTIQSIRALREHAPDLALPSHGSVIEDPIGDVDRLQRRLMDVVDLGPRMDAGSRGYLPEMRMVTVSPHLLWGGPWTISNFYVIKSESGKALFVDYGHSMVEHMHTGTDREDMETMRFVEHHLAELKRDHGIDTFDVVLPTHIHDDHTCGIPHLQEHYDVECWALDEVAQVLADPAAWSSTPCVFPEPIEIDRQFEDGASFQWEEYEFEIHHAPGQTEFHSMIATIVDGRDIAFTGDNYFERETHVHYDRREEQPFQTTVLRNSFQFWMHQKCKEVMRAIDPDLICPGHGELLDIGDDDVTTYCNFIDRKEEAFREVTAGPAEQGVDLFWARLVPYQTSVAPGERIEYTLLVRNNLGREATYVATLLAPDGRTPVDNAELVLPADERGEMDLAVELPDDAGPGREVLTAELSIDGESRGPVVEAIVRVE